jgi:hypothetical protein
VKAEFVVREQDQSGPVLPEVELLWQGAGEGTAVVLGSSRTDGQGHSPWLGERLGLWPDKIRSTRIMIAKCRFALAGHELPHSS